MQNIFFKFKELWEKLHIVLRVKIKGLATISSCSMSSSELHSSYIPHLPGAGSHMLTCFMNTSIWFPRKSLGRLDLATAVALESFLDLLASGKC